MALCRPMKIKVWSLLLFIIKLQVSCLSIGGCYRERSKSLSHVPQVCSSSLTCYSWSPVEFLSSLWRLLWDSTQVREASPAGARSAHYLRVRDTLCVKYGYRKTDSGRKDNRLHKCRLSINFSFKIVFWQNTYIHYCLFPCRRRLCQSSDHHVQCYLLHCDPCMGILLPLLLLQCTIALDKLWQHLEHW